MPSTPDDKNLRSGGNWLVGDAYYQLTRNCTRLFRLQVQPTYKVDWERTEFKHFLETGVRELDPNDPEIQQIRESHAKGHIRQRVYVLSQPLTDYQRWVLPSYRQQAEAGQEIRILDTSVTQNPGLPSFDFIFIDDSETVIRLHYETEDGTYIGRELLPDADPNAFRQYRELALSNSVSVLDYNFGHQ